MPQIELFAIANGKAPTLATLSTSCLFWLGYASTMWLEKCRAERNCFGFLLEGINIVNPNANMKLRDFRSLTSQAQETIRFRAMSALKEGRSKMEVAKIFGVSRQAVHEWIARQKKSGPQALQSKRRGRPVGGQLTAWQEQVIGRLIQDHKPDQLKLPFYFWTREAVGQLIAKNYSVKLSVWTVGRFLARWGFTPQRPLRRAYERDSDAVVRWLKETFPRVKRLPKRCVQWPAKSKGTMQSTILNRAWRRHAHIVFVDEAGFMLAPTLRRTWAPRGCTPVVHISDPHERISAIGAMSISPQYRRFCFHFHLLSDNTNFRGPSLVAFLDDLRRKILGPITLLWDEIPIHKARAVRRFLHKHRRIVVEEFPPYAPELNPVDYVWSYVKYSRLANYAPQNLDVLRKKVTAELLRLRKRPDLLRSFFKHTGLSLAVAEPSEN